MNQNDEYLIEAVNALRRTKIPHLNIRFPGEKMTSGSAVYICDDCYNPRRKDAYWITFNVFIPASDFDLAIQQIDFDAGIDGQPFDQRVVLRLGYRIYSAYKHACLNVEDYVKKNIRP